MPPAVVVLCVFERQGKIILDTGKLPSERMVNELEIFPFYGSLGLPKHNGWATLK